MTYTASDFACLRTRIKRQLAMEGVTADWLKQQELELLQYAISIGMITGNDADMLLSEYAKAAKLEEMEMLTEEKIE